jgi:NADH dehydrogenase
MAGFAAWLLWLVVHIYYLTGFKNRLLVVLQWAWSYLSFRRGARLIVNKEWRFNGQEEPRSPERPGANASEELTTNVEKT